MMRKKGLYLMILLALLPPMLSACGSRVSGAVEAAASEPPAASALPEKVEMYYVYDEICSSCDGTEAFNAIADEKLADVRELYPYAVNTVNIYDSGGADAYQLLCDAHGFDRDSLELPLMIVGGKTYQGHDSIGRNIKEAYLTAGEDLFVNGYVYNPLHKQTGAELFSGYTADPEHVTAVYFYRTVCDECNSIKPFVDGFPESVVIDGKTVPLTLIRINTRSGNNGDKVMAFFDGYGLPNDDRGVPVIFTAAGYYAGAEEITKSLPHGFADPDNLGFEFPTAAE